VRPPLASDATLQRHVLAATVISYVVVILDTSIVNVALELLADASTIVLAWRTRRSQPQ